MIRLFVRVIAVYCMLFGVLWPSALANRHGQDSKWIKPGALDRWGQQQKLHGKPNDGSCEMQTEPLQCDCPSPPEPTPSTPCSEDIIEDQRLALIFYQKLIKTLFAREALRADPDAPDHHYVDLSLQISSRQLDKLLDDSCSAREINLIVSAILGESTKTRRNSIFRENQCERLYNFLMQCFESKILHNLLPLILLIAVCYTVRLISRLTRIHPFLVFLLSIFSITVCNAWKECNEELAKQSLRAMESTPSFWRAMFLTKLDDSLPICDPLHVLVKSTVQVQAVYFESIFKELLKAYEKSTANAGIVQSFIIGLLFLGFTYVVITSLLTVGVSSGFKMFGNLVTVGMQSSRNSSSIDNRSSNSGQQQQLPSVNLNFHIGDSIAKTIPLNEILQQENQRIEIVPEEATGAIEQSPSESETNPAESLTDSENVEEFVAKNQTKKEMM